jgi:hypothetical protein
MSRLAQKHPDRIWRAKRKHANDTRGWIIYYDAKTGAAAKKADAKRDAEEAEADARYKAAVASQHAFDAARRRGNRREAGVATG